MKIVEKTNFMKFSDLEPGEVFVTVNGPFNRYFFKAKDNELEYAINLIDGSIYIRSDHKLYNSRSLKTIDKDEVVYAVECELHIKEVKESDRGI